MTVYFQMELDAAGLLGRPGSTLSCRTGALDFASNLASHIAFRSPDPAPCSKRRTGTGRGLFDTGLDMI